MKRILDILLSVKTAFYLFWVFVIIAFVGSVELPGHLSFYSGIDEEPLFRWLSENQVLVRTWWIYGLIIALALIAINTIFCTTEALLKRVKGRNLITKLMPQLMHIGVLFVMLGHLVTASYSFRTEVDIKKGDFLSLPDGTKVQVLSVKEILDEEGFPVDWIVTLKTPSGPLQAGPLRPVKVGAYTILAQAAEEDTAVLRAVQDPGAVWALVGGIIICSATLVFVISRRLT
ncbi:MAG: hypothetical protein D6778_06505 [Nitrospirae bacterium]|nr:MAG: hypothetical protein D6778_06505 [Nitrospirota bacterium]